MRKVKTARSIRPPLQFGLRTLMLSVVIVSIVMFSGILINRAVDSSRKRSLAAHSQSNLKLISLGLRNYHSRHGHFPPAFLPDKSGKPAHSWRILILPFIGEELTYSKYNFDEPWNGPNNSKIAASDASRHFHCSNDDFEKRETTYLAGVDVEEGLSEVKLVVEVTETGIHWMEPKDLNLHSKGSESGERIGFSAPNYHSGNRHVVTIGGQVRSIEKNVSLRDLRSLLLKLNCGVNTK